MAGPAIGTKRHNNAKVDLTHGIQFEDDAPKRPGVSASNRTRAEEGAGSDSD
jgi:hypothetical protein